MCMRNVNAIMGDYFAHPYPNQFIGCTVRKKGHYTTKMGNRLGQRSLKMVGEELSL